LNRGDPQDSVHISFVDLVNVNKDQDMLWCSVGQIALQKGMKNMSLRRFVIAYVALAAMGVMALPVQVQAQTPPPPTPSPAFERAFLGEMDAATRADVEKRATAGNTISGVIATTLLTDNQMARHGKAGGPITVVAVDFVRGVVVIQNGPDQYEPVRFDPKTLRILN
jgi:hypothetical protein